MVRATDQNFQVLKLISLVLLIYDVYLAMFGFLCLVIFYRIIFCKVGIAVEKFY